MNENLVHIQDAHGKRVQLTQDRLVYDDEVMDVGDIIDVRAETYGLYGDDSVKGIIWLRSR